MKGRRKPDRRPCRGSSPSPVARSLRRSRRCSGVVAEVSSDTKATDADDERARLAVMIDEHIHDLADLVVLRVIDVLLIPMGDGFAVARDARHHLSSRA